MGASESIEFVQNVVKEMVEAAESDLFEFQNGKPMTHKMKMLSKVVEVMGKQAWADMFVAYDGCRALGMWLQNLPNGVMPNVQLRTELLRMMLRLPITKEALANCKDTPLGQVVAKLSRNELETVHNRTVASTLVRRWVKNVLVDPNAANDEDPPEPMLPPKEPETMESLAKMEAEILKRVHPAIPVVGGRIYTVQPVSKDKPVAREKIPLDTNRGKLNEVIKLLSRPNKKPYKPYHISIAGRQMNMI